MNESPLSGALNAASEPTKKNKKGSKSVLLISGLALASSLGGVFAATTSIDLNGDNTLEFGQGLADATVCDATISTNLTQTFSSDEFYVNELIISDVDDAACLDKTLTWSLLSGIDAVLAEGAATGTVSVTTGNTSYTVNISGVANVVAADVAKVTVTSKD